MGTATQSEASRLKGFACTDGSLVHSSPDTVDEPGQHCIRIWSGANSLNADGGLQAPCEPMHIAS